jgi:hypothetical protein
VATEPKSCQSRNLKDAEAGDFDRRFLKLKGSIDPNVELEF